MMNLKILELYSRSAFVVLFFAIFIGFLACENVDNSNEIKEDEDVEFELQDYPVNSPLFTYEDSLDLKEGMASFQLEPGLRIELIAAEPLVADPSAIAFDEDGLMYVAENRGYPDPAEGGAPTNLGRIARLEDRDGDGRFDHRTEFVTGLTYPNGIMVWRGGIFVTCAPDIYYFKDTNGDGMADLKKVVLTGFNADKTAQIRTSHPTLGMDGWVYITSGLNGGEVISPEHPDRKPVAFSPSDGRFHPETLEFQTTGGRSQFGLTFDAYGRRFGSSNRHPLQHIVIEPWYLKRNPHLLFNQTIQNVAKAEADGIVYPISNAVTSADFIPKLIGLSHKGTFTSACGPIIYNGSALSKEHIGNAFICEPAQNLVQRQIMKPDGVSFRSELAYENREFLASSDSWFNPVFLTHGPYGALFLADMYRKVIDHPSYVPEAAQGELDFESGKGKGRIYRIVKKDFSQNSKSNQLGSSSSNKDLVFALGSKEEWVRSTAHRLLLEGLDPSVAPQLTGMAENGDLPESRARALWLLYALDALKVSVLKKALMDKELGVREQAVLLAGKLIGQYPELMNALINATGDAEIRVRYLSSLELGSVEGEKVINAMAQVAAKDGDNQWSRAAVLSSIGNQLAFFLETFRKTDPTGNVAYAAMMQDLGELFGNAASIADCQALLKDMIANEGGLDWRMATALGLLKGIEGRNEIKSDNGLVYALTNNKATNLGMEDLKGFMVQVAGSALNESNSLSTRVVATSLLGYTQFEIAGGFLKELLDAKNPPEIQLEAVRALARLNDPRSGEMLLSEEAWSAYTPRVKSAVISAMVARSPMVLQLFSAINDKVVAPAEISSMIRQRLMNDANTEISDKANLLFEDLEGGGRMLVYEEFLEVLENPSDPALGKGVFDKTCSSCHTYAGEGGEVGPDLTGVNNQPGDALLLHTIVPNYEVLPAYQAITVSTKDGRSISGWISAESENSMTLRTAFGTNESILRSNIVSIHNPGLSLMPDGLEQTMTKEDMANLIAFLKSGGI
ncbi:MAG: PVC-type heme-binding CxxCH protein [Cyclobacteriaceae bacterium]